MVPGEGDMGEGRRGGPAPCPPARDDAIGGGSTVKTKPCPGIDSSSGWTRTLSASPGRQCLEELQGGCRVRPRWRQRLFALPELEGDRIPPGTLPCLPRPAPGQLGFARWSFVPALRPELFFAAWQQTLVLVMDGLAQKHSKDQTGLPRWLRLASQVYPNTDSAPCVFLMDLDIACEAMVSMKPVPINDSNNDKGLALTQPESRWASGMTFNFESIPDLARWYEGKNKSNFCKSFRIPCDNEIVAPISVKKNFQSSSINDYAYTITEQHYAIAFINISVVPDYPYNKEFIL
ncbi:hypothetical protein llap_1766 [Limosa lapponica baueri]|uniref:Uncharacterized protein n=1 Tax=Limosa lapponica baueri TaxID=1758121 RepID=A0A2I0UPE0_LIMLA|nr:hypothetical protein llap_1766 [Limosa lapponica baueri]